MGKKKNGSNIQKSPKNTNADVRTNKSSDNLKPAAAGTAEDVHLTVYTLLSLLAVAMAGITTSLSGALSANPTFYGSDTYYGNGSDGVYVDIISQMLFEGNIQNVIKAIFIASAVVAGTGAIIALVDIICAMNPLKKPLVAFSWISLIFAVAAMVLYIVGLVKMYNIFTETDIFEKGFKFTIFVGTGIAHALNVIVMVCNIAGNYIGLKRFKKNGKAY